MQFVWPIIFNFISIRYFFINIRNMKIRQRSSGKLSLFKRLFYIKWPIKFCYFVVFGVLNFATLTRIKNVMLKMLWKTNIFKTNFRTSKFLLCHKTWRSGNPWQRSFEPLLKFARKSFVFLLFLNRRNMTYLIFVTCWTCANSYCTIANWSCANWLFSKNG